jgi:hypothetical protein
MRSQTLVAPCLMLTLAPAITCMTVVSLAPLHWGQRSSPLAALAMPLFGLFTPILWTTYIPALLLTPVFLNAADRRGAFRRMRFSTWFVTLSAGATTGALVMMPIIFLTLSDHELKLAIDWAISGGVAGAITLCVATLIYHRMSRIPPKLA